jgi:hypothetical protein
VDQSNDAHGEAFGLQDERPVLGFAFAGCRREARVDDEGFGRFGFHRRGAW